MPLGLSAQTETQWQNSDASATTDVAANAMTVDEAATLMTLLDDAPEHVMQQPEGTASATTNDEGPIGIVPAEHGFNASLVTSSQHDSSAGWESVLSPNVAYRFNRIFSANAGLPVYGYIVIDKQDGVTRSGKTIAPNYVQNVDHFLLGDTSVTGEFEAHPTWLDYSFDATLGIPTGDDADGLGAGQVTYNFNNHFERAFWDWFTPDIELGIGDSPNLDDTRVRKSFTTVGVGAHFQAGATFGFWHDISFDTEAYEDLPLGTQSVTSTTTNGKKGKALRIIKTTTEESIGEDNGFLNTLDIPLGGHVTLSGIYNHSLRNHDDTAGFAITFLLKSAKKAEDAAQKPEESAK